MKMLISVLIALSAQISLAECLGEAQIIARASEVTRSNANTCHIAVDVYSITVFNPSYVCPLDIDEVLASGIDINTTDENCFVQAGQEFSGVVVKKTNGSLVLE